MQQQMIQTLYLKELMIVLILLCLLLMVVMLDQLSFNDKVTIGDGKLVLNSTAVTSTAAELNLLDGVSGLVQADLTKLAAVDSTAAELNIVDGGTSATGTTLVDADRFVVNDNGTMVQVAASDLITYVNANSSAASTGKAIAMALVFG
jgi:hypothetical protein